MMNSDWTKRFEYMRFKLDDKQYSLKVPTYTREIITDLISIAEDHDQQINLLRDRIKRLEVTVPTPKEIWGAAGVGSAVGWDVCVDQTLDCENHTLEIGSPSGRFRFSLGKDAKTGVENLIKALNQALAEILT